jgi:predicted ATPase/DNA-binding winged helix-turn-helix (wHTH) protein
MEPTAYRAADRTFSFGQFSLIPARQLLLRNGIPIRLGSRALSILTTLVERRGELVSREELMATAWPKLFVHESNLRVNMASLRRSLGDTQKQPIYVATVVGRGYRFVAPVEISASVNIDVNAGCEAVDPSGLPPTREIVGRDEEIARIVTELRARKHVTVVGAGGIGKTTVAIAAAQALGSEYSGGACFVDLSTFDDPMLLPSALAAALGISGNADEMLNAVIDHLKQRRMLVLLDNCEHVLPAAAIFARKFAASGGQSRLLATSRQPLGTVAEHVVRLDPLAIPDATDGFTIEEAMRFAALDLFARRRSGLAMIWWNPIVRPLRKCAVRWTASRSRSNWLRPTAAIGPVDVTICLGSLVAKSLLTAEVNGAGLRYRLLDSTRRYARERLREDPMENDIRLRHAERILAIFEQAEREWDRHETDGWTGRYLDRLPDLRAVLTWAFGPGRCAALGVRLVTASLPFWFAIALISEALARVEEALNYAESSSSDDLLKTKLACSRAWILMYVRTRIRETEDAWLATISLARHAGDVGYQLHALVGLAYHNMDTGRIAEGAKWLHEFRVLSTRHQNWSAAPEGERSLAWSKVHTGELVESRQIFDRMVARYPRPNAESLVAGFRIDPYIGIRCYLPLCA